MDELNLDFIMDINDDELPTPPEIPKVQDNDINNNDNGLKIKKSDEPREEDISDFDKEIKETQYSSGFWDASYNEPTNEEIRNRRKSKLIIKILSIIFILAIVSTVCVYVFNRPHNHTDITGFAKCSESELASRLNLSFSPNIQYTSRTRILSDDIVTAVADQSFSVIYVNNKQEGIFFDSKDYTLYGLSVGDDCDESFKGLTFDYDNIYEEEVSMGIRKRHFYYLYNIHTQECMIVSINARNNKIKELGFYRNYNVPLKRIVGNK